LSSRRGGAPAHLGYVEAATHIRTISAFTPQPQGVTALWLVLIAPIPTKGWPGSFDLGGWLHTEINFPHRELNPDTAPIPVLTGPDVGYAWSLTEAVTSIIPLKCYVGLHYIVYITQRLPEFTCFRLQMLATHIHDFYSCDLDLDPITLVYESDLTTVKMYHWIWIRKMNSLDQAFRKVEHYTNKQADRCDPKTLPLRFADVTTSLLGDEWHWHAVLEI